MCNGNCTHEIYADCTNVAFSICVVRESQQQTTLSDSRVSDKQKLEKVIAANARIHLAFVHDNRGVSPCKTYYSGWCIPPLMVRRWGNFFNGDRAEGNIRRQLSLRKNRRPIKRTYMACAPPHGPWLIRTLTLPSPHPAAPLHHPVRTLHPSVVDTKAAPSS